MSDEGRLEHSYKGNSAHRLAVAQENPRERAFAEEWVKENQGFMTKCETRTLGMLLSTRPNEWQRPTERDEIVAATVIQWLGSNVGFSFVEQALARCGYRIVKEAK